MMIMTRAAARSLRRRDQGFTMVELLVVVIIIGVLAAIAIPAYLNQRKKSIDAALKNDFRNYITIATQVALDDPTGNTASAAYFSGSGSSPGNLVAAGVKKSAGSTIRIAGSPADGFCLVGYAAGGTLLNSSRALWFDSAVGSTTVGGNPGTANCASATVTSRFGWITPIN